MEEYIGPHNPSDVVALADSGYDNKNIAKTIISKKWDFIIALKSSRCVKSPGQYNITGEKPTWNRVKDFFKNQRKRYAWETIRIYTDNQEKREDFRIRHIIAWFARSFMQSI